MIQKIVVSILMLLAFTSSVSALYADEKGKNDWLMENIGEVVDAVFIGNKKSFLLSEDNLLTLFDNQIQKSIWRKELPTTADESYTLRHVDDRLIAYSNERALMINVAGQVLFEVPILGSGKTVIEFYRDRNGNLISCFVRGDRVLVYIENQRKGDFQIISDVKLLPESFDDLFQPLEIFHDGQGSLFLVVKEGQDDRQSLLTTYNIDIDRLRSEKVAELHFKKPFVSSLRTRFHLILSSDDERLVALNPKTLELKLEWKGKNTPWGINDDYILNERNEIIDLYSQELEWQRVQAGSICNTQRARQSGTKTNPQEFSIPFVIECGQHLKIANDDLVIFQSTSQYGKRGEILRAFQQTDNSEFLLVFSDLSLHYIQGGKKIWEIEQALSKVIQVEVFDSASLSENKISDLKYVENMGKPVAFIDVPQRILQRYIENFEFLLRSVQQIFENKDETSISTKDTYGFKKSLILLTKPGKLFAVSSYDGAVQWSYYNPAEKVVKVFVEQLPGSDAHVSIILITEKMEIHLNPLTGSVITKNQHSLDVQNYLFMLVKNGEHTQSVLAVPKGAQSNEQKLKFTGNQVQNLVGDQPLFYTQVQAQTISGFKIDKQSLIGNKIWSVNVGADQRIVDIRTQFSTASLATESSYVLPTAFGVEGVLLYKYLDSNVFAISTQNQQDLGRYTILFVNGVTGSIIHQQQIANLSPNHNFATVMSENFFAATFQRWNPDTGLTQQELLFVELFANKQEDDTKRLLMDYFKDDQRITATTYSSLKMETTPLIAMETYILPQSIKSIALSETQHHITSRALVCITTENQVYTIKDTFYSSRRPYPPVVKDFEALLKDALEDPDKVKPIELKSEALPRYEPIIPQQNKKYLSYDLKIIGLRELKTFTTRLESTTQVLAIGHDLFLARMMPDNGYDLLDEGFSYFSLFAAIIGITVADICLSKYLKQRSIVKTFLTR